MSGRLKHRPVSSSRSVGSTSAAPRENNGLASASQQATEKKKTRSRTDSGERLPESERPTIKAAGENWEVHPYRTSRKPPTALKNGVDPGIAGAWLHNHELNRGTNDGRLCNQNIADKWAQYEEGMEKKYGANWKIEHPELDASVIYECAGRMPHGKLGIGDGAISVDEKEAIKTRKRSAQPLVSAKEKRLERENLQLQNKYSNLEHVVRTLAAKQGMDFDMLAQETGSNLPTFESEVAFSREDKKTVPNASEHDNIGGENYSGDDSEDNTYDYEDEVYHSQDDGKYYVKHGYDDDGAY